MVTVAIIEDCRNTGSLLCNYLRMEFPRLVDQRWPPLGSRNQRTGYQFKSVGDEPGQGQLHQLRPLFDPKKSSYTSDEPSVVLFPTDRIPELQHAAQEYDPRSGHQGDERSAEASALVSLVNAAFATAPDVLVVDLVLDEDEGGLIEEAGGLQRFDHESTVELDDPRTALRGLTGFRVLHAMAGQAPVIATSFLANPLIRQHCIVNGAVGFVAKPVPSTDRSGNNMDFASVGSQAHVFEESAKTNRSALDVVVTNYLTEAAAEVAKAMYVRWHMELH